MFSRTYILPINLWLMHVCLIHKAQLISRCRILQYLNNLFEVINLHSDIFLIIPLYFTFETLNEDIFNC